MSKRTPRITIDIGGEKGVVLKKGVWISVQGVASGRLRSIAPFDYKDDHGKNKTDYRVTFDNYLSLDEIDYVSFTDEAGVEHRLHAEKRRRDQ